MAKKAQNRKKSVLIVGSGPAGLAAGLELTKNGFDVTIIERENQVGGISKTILKNGNRFDVGGHRFFTKSKEVNKLWEEVLGKDFRETNRLSRIYYNNKFFAYPIEIADTLKKLGFFTSLACLLSFIRYQLFPIKPQRSFADWTTNRFGYKLFEMFFKSYTEKVWGISTNDLSADWAAQRIKGLSLFEAIKTALFKTKKRPKSLIDKFKYPKHGPGMMYEKFAQNIEKRGGKIVFNVEIAELTREKNKIVNVVGIDGMGKRVKYSADYYISTMPLPDTVRFLSPTFHGVADIEKKLKFRDFLSVNLVVNCRDIFPDAWIYVHDPSVDLGRIQNFKNWSHDMAASAKITPLGCEYFCSREDALWRKSDKDLIALASHEMEQIGLIKKSDVLEGNVYRMTDAYPIYNGDYQKYIEKSRLIIDEISNLHVAGRGGMFRYNNMDHSILSGLYVARNIMGKNLDVWGINADEEYHETEK